MIGPIFIEVFRATVNYLVDGITEPLFSYLTAKDFSQATLKAAIASEFPRGISRQEEFVI